MNTKAIIFLSIACLLCGLCCFLIQREHIIFRFQYPIHSNKHYPINATDKKQVVCYFWHNNSWHEENHLCLWSDKKETNLKQLLTVWLSTVEQELLRQTVQKTIVQSVAFNQSGHHVFISFDHNPLPQDGPLHLKIMWIEGLLKTIKSNGIIAQCVSFLHNHQILEDTHLDFSQPWPIVGFLAQSAPSHHADL